MEVTNENTYSHGRDKMSNSLNRSLLEFLCFAPIMILKIFFYTVNILLLYGEPPPPPLNYSIFNYIVKLGKANCFESVSVLLMSNVDLTV